MRNFGLVLLLLGVLGFFYSSTRAGEAAPVPAGLSLAEEMSYPAGRWEMARYACAALAGFGVLLAMFPRGR
jgi:hypothetical protein